MGRLQAHEEALKKFSIPVPPRVSGFMMIDTGASSTCMALDVAQALSLRVIRMQRGFGAGGEHESPVFEALLRIGIAGPKGDALLVDIARQVAGIKDMERYFDGFAGLNTTERYPKRLIGLIGRDILSHTDFRYNGRTGEFRLIFDLASLGAKPAGAPMPPPSA